MKRAERLYAVVDLLRGSHLPTSAARLSREFDVSARTIERDIQSLQVAGVPIYADHGAAGGYSILKEFSLPPLNLTASESLAVLAGLGLLESSPYGAAVRRARAKILAVMDDDRLAPVQSVLSTMHVIEAPAPDPVPGEPGEVPTDLLSDAITARRVVRLGYLGDDGVSTTTRDVETMGLLRGGDSWLLVGWCRLRDGIRGFHLERITRLEITDEVPPTRDPALLDTDLARWPTRRLGSRPGAQ
ncbi:transcriptional regulator [Frondihabitans sp. PAMC 28766]|uniref:helix-turn-helix transcriptional regulator n=1 Tax=Frondihabitans sp. PAMC 28766 TaxID=1795630 RepID=UPI00078CA317|nr:WYL domain-containing protein [Frondihabitans sp. PAMC 28766]AMM21492.1 transcriptional regulator [Frondihabitans sp. PAMC 28766]